MPDLLSTLSTDWFFVAMIAFTGLYCLLVSRNMLRLLIGVEILSKAGVLALLACGQALGNINLAQTLAITMIVVEVVVVAVGLALIVRSYSQSGRIDIWQLVKLKG